MDFASILFGLLLGGSIGALIMAMVAAQHGYTGIDDDD